MPRHEFAGFVERTRRKHLIRFCLSHARQAQQLVFSGGVQIERLVAAPALADSFRHGFGVALYRLRGPRGLFFDVLRTLLLIAACDDAGQQQYDGSVTISGKFHWSDSFRLSWLKLQPSGAA